MPAVIFSGNEVKALKPALDLNGVGKVLTSTDDPTSVAKDAPRGSILIRDATTLGEVYTKDDNGSTTNWTRLEAGVSANDTFTATNLSLSTSISTGALTIALKDRSGADPSPGSPVRVAMRDPVATDGSYIIRSISAALSITIPSTAELGFRDSQDHFVFVYLVDNSGTISMAVTSSGLIDDTILQTVAAIGVGSDDDGLYGTALAPKPVRLIGRLRVNNPTTGTWTDPDKITVGNYLTTGAEVFPMIDYSATGTTSIPSSPDTILDFGSQNTDTHSAVTTGVSWVWGCTLSGRYQFSCHTITESIAWAVGNVWVNRLYKDGSVIRELGRKRWDAARTDRADAAGSCTLDVKTGEEFNIRIEHNRSGNVSNDTAFFTTYFMIARIG